MGVLVWTGTCETIKFSQIYSMMFGEGQWADRQPGDFGFDPLKLMTPENEVKYKRRSSCTAAFACSLSEASSRSLRSAIRTSPTSELVTAPRDSRKAPRTLPALLRVPGVAIECLLRVNWPCRTKKYLLISDNLIAVFSYLYLLSSAPSNGQQLVSFS